MDAVGIAAPLFSTAQLWLFESVFEIAGAHGPVEFHAIDQNE